MLSTRASTATGFPEDPTTALLLNKIRLDAVVGGNEVSNPFAVTEVYVQQNGSWKLGALSFTRLLQ